MPTFTFWTFNKYSTQMCRPCLPRIVVIILARMSLAWWFDWLHKSIFNHAQQTAQDRWLSCGATPNGYFSPPTHARHRLKRTWPLQKTSWGRQVRSLPCARYLPPLLESTCHDGDDHRIQGKKGEELFVVGGASALSKFSSRIAGPDCREWTACGCLLGSNY